MYRFLAQEVCGSTTITYNGTEIDLGKPFRRLTMVDAIKEETGIDFDQVTTDEEAKSWQTSATSSMRTVTRRATSSTSSSTSSAKTR
jgi:lysyl-tRNA synthetase class II